MKQLIFIACGFFVTFQLFAASEQYVVRTEVSFCKYNEGKDYDDVVKYQQEYEKFLRKNNLKYSKSILTPVLAGNNEFDFVLWGTWPDGSEMYKEYGAYLNDFKNPKTNPATCNGNFAFINTAARHLRIDSEDYDRIQFVDFANCKFTEESDFQELLKVSAKHEEYSRELGAEGYGVHYLRPYRGFNDDVPYDMVRMVHWYNSDKRAEAAAKWPETRDFMREKGIYAEYAKHVQCGQIRTFGMEWLYDSSS
tara:strand:- start:41616 stop:42368 length:753 start_codon:yes stop_codon:yes gene_type:complete